MARKTAQNITDKPGTVSSDEKGFFRGIAVFLFLFERMHFEISGGV